LSSNRVRPGQTITINIESTSGAFQFRGFMLQTRAEVLAGGPTGTFLPGAGYRVMNCEGPTTATHVEATPRSGQALTWTAPQTIGGVRAQ
jgi:hypothetical protein